MTASKNQVRHLVYLFFFSLGAILTPVLFHQLQLPGKVFIPLFAVILIGAPFFSLLEILSLALVGPLINHIFFGMPVTAPLPILQMLIFELAVLALLLNLALKKLRLPVILRFLLPLVLARFSSIIFVVLSSPLTIQYWFQNQQTSWPGIFLNTTLASLVFNLLSRETDSAKP